MYQARRETNMRERPHSVLLRSLAGALACLVAACVSEPAAPPAPMTPAEAGSPAQGRLYAQEACAACHAIDRGATDSPNPDAPAFATLADTPGMTGLALTVWLNSSHSSMPDLIVPPERIDDLAAYIQTLKTTRIE
jgi:mono/diheme cytochrome c family protein